MAVRLVPFFAGLLFLSCVHLVPLCENTCEALPSSYRQSSPSQMITEANRFMNVAASLDEKRLAYRLSLCAYGRVDNSAFAVARAAFFLATEEPAASVRRSIASRGRMVAGAEYAIRPTPELAFYYAATRGIEMQFFGISAIYELPPIITLLEKALENPSTEEGGPYRALAMIFLSAPGKYHDIPRALSLMTRGCEAFPRYPHNFIILARAQAEDGLDDEAEASLKRAELLIGENRWGEFNQRSWSDEIKTVRRILTR